MQIPTSIISLCLTSLGSILAVWGVLLDKPRNVINQSIVGNDGPGFFILFRNPTIISNFMHYRNKALLSLILISVGFALNLPYVKNVRISFYVFILLVELIIFLGGIIAGATRKKIIDAWKSPTCYLHEFLNRVLSISYIDIDSTGTTVDNEHLQNALTNFLHIHAALDMGITLPKKNDNECWTSDELKKFQKSIQEDLKNIKIWYYFSNHFKKLILAYK